MVTAFLAASIEEIRLSYVGRFQPLFDFLTFGTLRSPGIDDRLVGLPQPGATNAPTAAMMMSNAYRFRAMN